MKKRKRNSIFIVIILVIDMLLVSLNIIVRYCQLQDGHGNTFKYSIALLCNDLTLGPDEDGETFGNNNKTWTFSVNSEGKYMCESKNISSAVDQVVERQSRFRLALGLERQQYLSCGNQSLAPRTGYMVAFFTRISHTQYSENGIQAKLNWDRHKDHSYIHPEMTYQDGEVTIPVGRTYFVYGSALFNLTMNRGQFENLPHRLSIRICKIVYGYERTILGKTELVQGNQTSSMRSLNINGVLMLRKDDILLMRVSDLQGLHRESKGNTFGVFPV